MAVGKSGRVVVDLDPDLKRRLHASLSASGMSMKEWFVLAAERAVGGRDEDEASYFSLAQTSGAKESAVTTIYSSDLAIPETLFEIEEGPSLIEESCEIGGHQVNRITGEFWTAGQRQAANIHEVSYRACFKPQLPAYFIKRFTRPGDVVYDPFSGRGTTAIEAGLWGRQVIANDVNPLSSILAKPRLQISTLDEIAHRLDSIAISPELRADIDLSMFYHPETEAELVSLKNYLTERHRSGSEDEVDSWIRMVATNRLTGHSSGFFSVYSFPPNQAVSQESQRRINHQRGQVPDYRDTRRIILKKSRQLLSGLSQREIATLQEAGRTARFITGDARSNLAIADNSVQLTVTSPPFLDIVQYADDNWLRCWFNDLPIESISQQITLSRTVQQWSETMGAVFRELYRITAPGGVVAFEVGEVRKGKVKLEEQVIPLGLKAGFLCEVVLINAQKFTKTANIWGVSNNEVGTNTNRIVVFKKS